jgi:hypothetical protein
VEARTPPLSAALFPLARHQLPPIARGPRGRKHLFARVLAENRSGAPPFSQPSEPDQRRPKQPER